MNERNPKRKVVSTLIARFVCNKRAAAIILGALYSAFLFSLFVCRFFLPTGYAGTGAPNFMPFKTIAVYLSGQPS